MFQLQRIGATAWSPDGRYATIGISNGEVSKGHRWLAEVPEYDLLRNRDSIRRKSDLVPLGLDRLR